MDGLPDKGSVRDYMPVKHKSGSTPSGLSVYRPDHPQRIMVYSNLYYRDAEAQVKNHVSKFVRLTQSKEDIYTRRIVVGEEWVKLDTGWLTPENVGYLRIRNDGGKAFNVQPTPEQIQEEQSRIIDVGYILILPEKEDKLSIVKTKRTMFDPPIKIEPAIRIEPVPMWMIHIHEHVEGKPHPTFPIYLRCRHGEVKATVVALPN